MKAHTLNANELPSMDHLQKANKIARFVRKSYKVILKTILVIALVISMYVISVTIHESPELYMLKNWNTMQDFARFHKEHKGDVELRSSEDFQQNLSQ